MRSLFQRFDITDESGRVTSYVVRVAGSKDEAAAMKTMEADALKQLQRLRVKLDQARPHAPHKGRAENTVEGCRRL